VENTEVVVSLNKAVDQCMSERISPVILAMGGILNNIVYPRPFSLVYVKPELSMGPFCVTQPNPLQVGKFGPNPTQLTMELTVR